jgi:replicative DNA helicase
MINNLPEQPYDLRAEQGLIATMVYTGIPHTCLDITADHFHDNFCREVFTAIKNLSEKGSPITMSTIGDFVGTKIAWYTTFPSLVAWSADYASNILRAQLKLRKIWRLSYEIHHSINQQSDIENVTKNIEQLQRVALDSYDTGLTALQVEHSRKQELEKRKLLKSQGKPYIGDETGFTFLDKICDGIRPASYWVIAGASSTGKSAVSNNIMAKLLDQGKSVHLFTFEMIPEIYNTRLLSIMSGVTYDKIDKGYDPTGESTPEEIRKIDEASEKLSKMKLTFHGNADTRAIQTSLDMLKYTDCDYVFIDYLQVVDTPDSVREYEAYKKLSRKLQRFAFENSKTVILISQMSNENINSFETVDSQAKGSGDVKNNSTHFISISDYFNKKLRQKRYEQRLDRVITIRVEKNQRGMTGAENYYYDGTRYGYRVAPKAELEAYDGNTSNPIENIDF